ncbi:2699_t:CDS:10 [Diversispora eburnea]|uniref:2699_t:CDS:1 n=1 Tax=Diversispora eburnea TaxID=1213867 RepID=A0A9N8YQC9_9GLOM|nr:2699_t:CDS:10 [Diversispora eburnea]
MISRYGSSIFDMPPSTTTSWLANRNYGVVIDAGSSGSRVQIYSWKDHRVIRESKDKEELRHLPVIERGDEHGLKWQKKVEPGISSFASNPSQVGEGHLKELIDFALEVIPYDQVSETQIYLLATAGMRLLPPSQQNAILQNACDYIMFQNRFKMFEKCSDHIQVISGEKEGIYGWVAVNYLKGGFEFDKGNHNVEHNIRHEAKKHANDLTTVTLWTLNGQQVEYQVFVTTFLGYGTNEARRRYIDNQINNYNEKHEKIINPDSSREQPVFLIDDPCLPKDLALTDRNSSPPYYTLKGTGSFDKCLNNTYSLLNKTAECVDEPCLFNGIHTPNIDFSVNNFIGISEYWYTSEDLFNLGGSWNYEEFTEKARNYCGENWNEIYSEFHRGVWNSSSIDLPRLEMQCFKSACVDKINDMQVSWTLGKMVLEASSTIPLLLGPRPRPPPNPQHHGILGYYNFLVEWMMGISIIIMLLIVIWWACTKKNGPWIGRRLSIGLLYSCLLSRLRNDGGPEYNRLEGGQYSPSATIGWKIATTIETSFRGLNYVKWKITHRISSPFRKIFTKKNIESNENMSSLQIEVIDDLEEMVQLRVSPVSVSETNSDTSINIKDISLTPPIITDKASPTEQYFNHFPSQRYLSKKRFSGDSTIQNGPMEAINKAFSTPINLSLTGLQSRNNSSSNLVKYKERIINSTSSITTDSTSSTFDEVTSKYSSYPSSKSIRSFGTPSPPKNFMLSSPIMMNSPIERAQNSTREGNTGARNKDNPAANLALAANVEVLFHTEFTIKSEEKFMTYFTHSGYHNQLNALENALLLAKLLDRTLLLPPALLGPPIPWGKYSKLYERLLTTTKTGLEHCKKISKDFQLPVECLNYFTHTKVSWDFLLNIEPLRKWHPIVDRWEQSFEWLEKNLNINRVNDIYSIKDSTLYDYCIYDSSPPMSTETNYSTSKYKRKIDLDSLAKIKKKIIHFGSLFGMNRVIVEKPENIEHQKFIEKHLVTNNEILLKISNNIIKQLGGIGNYIGIHLRITDGFFMKTARLTIDRMYHEIIDLNTNLTPEEVDLLEGGTHEQDILLDDTIDLGENNNFNISTKQKIMQRSKSKGELNDLTSKDEESNEYKGELKREENDETRSSFLKKCHKPLHPDSGVNTVIFIATDAKSPRTNPLLYKFFNTFPCVFVLDDFEKDLIEVKSLRNSDDKTQLVKYLIPMLDAMISAKGKEFYGTPRSTFIKAVNQMTLTKNVKPIKVT